MNDEKTQKDRIMNACLEAHRANDDDSFTDIMSDRTLTAWRACKIGRFGKPKCDLTNDEISILGNNLAGFITYALQDIGKAYAGLLPRDEEPFDEERPTRNRAD